MNKKPVHIYVEKILFHQKKSCIVFNQEDTSPTFVQLNQLTNFQLIEEAIYFECHSQKLSFLRNSIRLSSTFFFLQSPYFFKKEFLDQKEVMLALEGTNSYQTITNSLLHKKIGDLVMEAIELGEINSSLEIEIQNLQVELLEEYQVFRCVYPTLRILEKYSRLEKSLLDFILSRKKHFQNKGETKFLACNLELNSILEKQLKFLLCYCGKKQYNSRKLYNKRKIQLQLSYLLLFCFGLKENDLVRIRIIDMRDLVELRNVQIGKRNILLNASCKHYFDLISGLNDFLYHQDGSNLLWGLNQKRLISLLNQDLTSVLESAGFENMKCHKIRTQVLTHLLSNQVYRDLDSKKLGELFGLSPSYIRKFLTY